MKHLKIRFLGHNAWRLTYEKTQILIDPFLSGNPAAACGPDEVEADYILVSHGHGDHFGDTLAIARQTGATVLAIAEIAGYVGKHGVKRTVSMNLGGGATLPFGRVQMVPALHSSTLPDGTPGGSSAGFLLTFTDGTRLYFACDTALFRDMELFGREKLQYAFLPIGDLFTMGPSDALEAVKLLNAETVIPCHYNTWPQIAQDANAWKKRVETETSSRVVILKSGESIER